MSNIARWKAAGGEWVRYDDHRAEVERLRANGQAILDRSRPTDEDIWREAFMAAVRSRDIFPTKTANKVLAEYRKRWPR